MSGILKVIHNIIRGFVRLALLIVLTTAQALIYLVTFEPGKKKELTVRKAKRIRFLTKLKMRFLNGLPEPVAKYIGVENYKNYLNSHLNHGLQLCDEGTDRCVV